MATIITTKISSEASTTIQEHIRTNDIRQFNGRLASVNIFCRDLIEYWADSKRAELEEDKLMSSTQTIQPIIFTPNEEEM